MSVDAGKDDSGIANLRYDLKKWEKLFADSNGGRKATREDIKNDATIAAKYAKYDRLHRQPARPPRIPRESKQVQHSDTESGALRDRSTNVVTATPKKQSRTLKSLPLPKSPAKLEEEQTPACVRWALGPTPQKDGEMLGIFDILPAPTPSKAGIVPSMVPEPLVCATPSKPSVSFSEPALSRTPQSSGKRFYLDAFAGTPLKRKRDDERCTPSTAKRQFATPSFLRRTFSLSRIDEESSETTRAQPPFKKRGFVRSLSSIIQGLKKQEEQKMDEEWEIMNEIEEEECRESTRPNVPKLMVEDSQAVEMPLGPDQGIESSDESDKADPGALDANGKPRKVWKKKGLKRQTRRVMMRPVVHKPKKAEDKEHSSSESEPEVVEETQQDKSKRPKRQDSDDEHDGSGNETQGSGYQQSLPEPPKDVPKKQKKAKRKNSGDETHADHDDIAKKQAKKTNAQAHANFRRLKIRNKNSKANGRGRKLGRR